MMMMIMRHYLLVLALFLVAVSSSSAVQEEEAKETVHQQQEQQGSPEKSNVEFESTSPLRTTNFPPPSWDDLDKLPLADWYGKAKFGIFIHWGVFSVPAFGSEWFQNYWQNDVDAGTPYGDQYRHFVQATERPNFAYAEYAHRFTAEFYQPNDWANIFAQSGAQYIVLTSKHHEGFCNWDSRNNISTTWNWNSMDIGPRKDLVGELATAIRTVTSPHTQRPIKFGLYHSLYEWFNPLYLQDKKNNFTTQHFVNTKTLPELYDLVNKYQPELIWSDGEWEAPSSYWKATQFLHWYATQSSVKDTAVWNDRWGSDTLCRHGAYLTCTDRYNPGKYDKNATRKWENALTIDKTSWGYNRNASYTDYLTVPEIIHNLIQVVAWNGNMLLNVGPAADGTIHPIFVDRLVHLGEWLKVNGRAIYDTEPWPTCQNETLVGVYYTTTTRSDNDSDSSSNSLFVHVTTWPSNNILTLKCPQPTSETRISMLGMNETKTTTTTTDPSSSSHVVISWSYLSNNKKMSTRAASPYPGEQDGVLPKRNLVGVSGSGDHRSSLQQQQQEHDSDKYSHDDDDDDTGIVIQLPALTPDIIPCQHAWVLELSNIANLQ